MSQLASTDTAGGHDAYVRRWTIAYWLAAMAAAGVVVYGSLIPFDFRTPAGGASLGLTVMVAADASRTDFVSNVLLFLPFPFFLMGAACAGRTATARVAAAVIVPVATAGLAWAVEWCQQFLPSRTASWNDVLAAVVAAALALVLWTAAGARLTRWADAIVSQRQPRTRIEAVLLVYAVLIAFLQLLPLDVTIRPAELAEKYRAGRVLLVPSLPDDLAGARDAAGDVLRAIPFGLLALVGWSVTGTRRSPALAFLAGLTAVAAIEGAQLFVFSRVFDATDVILGAVGVAAGVWIGQQGWLRSPARADGAGALWVRAGLIVWGLILLGWHWYPFAFSLDLESVRARLPELIDVPFRAYYSANPFDALDDAARKGLLALPLGALLWLGWPPRSTSSPASRRVVLATAAALFFAAIELGQVLLPGRFPDITDVVIGAGGAAAGMWLLARLVVARPIEPR